MSFLKASMLVDLMHSTELCFFFLLWNYSGYIWPMVCRTLANHCLHWTPWLKSWQCWNVNKISVCKTSHCYASDDHVNATNMNDCIDHGHIHPRCHGNRRGIPEAHRQFTYSSCLSTVLVSWQQPVLSLTLYVNGEGCLSNLLSFCFVLVQKETMFTHAFLTGFFL